MKLIIDIPKQALNVLKNEGVDWLGTEHILDAVSKGIPYEGNTAHWVEEPGNIPHCSVCGTYSDDADREDGGFYCTHCGSLMVDTQDKDQ